MSPPPNQGTTIRIAAATLACTMVALGIPLISAASTTRQDRVPAAHAAHTLNATDTGHLRWIRSSGTQLYEEGSATGTLPGKMRAWCEVGPVTTAIFTIYVHGGSITGQGKAKTHGSGRYQSFAGSLTVTHGTGRYAHAHGHAGLYGVFDRRTYALTLQTTGRLTY